MQVFGLLGYTGEPAQAQAGRANCTPKAAPSPHMKLRDTQGGEKKKTQRKNNLKTNKQNKTRLKKKRKKKSTPIHITTLRLSDSTRKLP